MPPPLNIQQAKASRSMPARGSRESSRENTASPVTGGLRRYRQTFSLSARKIKAKARLHSGVSRGSPGAYIIVKNSKVNNSAA